MKQRVDLMLVSEGNDLYNGLYELRNVDYLLSDVATLQILTRLRNFWLTSPNPEIIIGQP